MSNKYLASKQSMPRRQARKLSRADLIANLKGSGVKGPLSKMNKSQLQKMHNDRTEVATDQDQTLSVMSGSAATNLQLSGSGHSSGIHLEGKGMKQSGSGMKQSGSGMKQSGSGMKQSGSGHCSGGGKQGRGLYQQLVKKHGGNMRAASEEYKKQKGSGIYPDFVEDGMDALNEAGRDLFGSGAELDVEKYMEEGNTDQDGGSLSEYLDNISKAAGAVAAGAALIPGVGEVVAPVAGTISGITKAGSTIADITGNGVLDVEQYMD